MVFAPGNRYARLVRYCARIERNDPVVTSFDPTLWVPSDRLLSDCLHQVQQEAEQLVTSLEYNHCLEDVTIHLRLFQVLYPLYPSSGNSQTISPSPNRKGLMKLKHFLRNNPKLKVLRIVISNQSTHEEVLQQLLEDLSCPNLETLRIDGLHRIIATSSSTRDKEFFTSAGETVEQHFFFQSNLFLSSIFRFVSNSAYVKELIIDDTIFGYREMLTIGLALTHQKEANTNKNNPWRPCHVKLTTCRFCVEEIPFVQFFWKACCYQCTKREIRTRFEQCCDDKSTNIAASISSSASSMVGYGSISIQAFRDNKMPLSKFRLTSGCITRQGLSFNAGTDLETCNILSNLLLPSSLLSCVDRSNHDIGELSVVNLPLLLDSSWVQVAASLGQNTTLQVLRLLHVGLGNDGLAAIVQALTQHSTLQVLDIRWNRKITMDGMTVFKDHLGSLRCLESFCFGNSNDDDDDNNQDDEDHGDDEDHDDDEDDEDPTTTITMLDCARGIGFDSHKTYTLSKISYMQHLSAIERFYLDLNRNGRRWLYQQEGIPMACWSLILARLARQHVSLLYYFVRQKADLVAQVGGRTSNVKFIDKEK